ncbi:MAG: elongation factor 1-alpha C-terminal domain-related protein, partial [bacterium]
VDLLTLSPAAPAGQAGQPTQANHAGQTGQATAENHHSQPASLVLHENDVGRVHLRTSGPMVFDPYAINRATGSFILIDPITTGTVGGAMLVEPIEETQ